MGALGMRVSYDYPGGAIVHRDPGKKFWQDGNKSDTSLFQSEMLAERPDDPVLVVEGEKDAQTVTFHFPTHVAVSPRQGAHTDARRFDWSPLKGRDVTIVADNDEQGRAHAEKVRALLTNVAGSVRVKLPAAGKDLTDHYQNSKSIDELIDAAPAESTRCTRSLAVTFGDQVKAKPIEWMIDDWIPWGFLTLLAGREGLGKSTIACKIAAERTQQGERVIYLASEDSIDHVVAPRLQAAGADMANVLFLNVVTEHSDTGTVEFPADLDAVEDLIVEHDVRLVVLDAVTSVVSQSVAGDGNNDRRIRAVLEPMAAVAARRSIVMLGLCHFGKKESADTGKLMMGSIAWSQVARSVLAVAADEDAGHLVVTNTKANLAKRKRSEAVEIVTRSITDAIEIGAAEWRGETGTSATDLLGDADEREERSEVQNWIYDYLLLHPDSWSREVKREGVKALGGSERRIAREANKIGVKVRDGAEMPRKTYWSLPNSEDSTPGSVLTVPTVPTGDDLHKRDVPTGIQSGQGVPTGIQSGHSVFPVQAQLGQSGQWGHDSEHKCIACSEDLIFADDIADGFHAADPACTEAARKAAS
jgi:hypothetical protein